MKIPENTQKTNTQKYKKITNRPWLTQPERVCPCGRPYRYPWAWAIILPSRTLIDLCSRCSRALRYGDEIERNAVTAMLARNDRRVAA
jgi:hypothetical protein